ncbi:MBL fold metallo-hydrolase [Alteraurantiacibacter aestuarii]|uniref:MBL fold metallo-hydrolase n=1 Tax=Alteraurantiacibacter aestuarii TaxID=650004 RepID=A0A844ZT81_9SPHN|nr:MBL fold metallo-hydrolase [Alteraurantiacibacter aestuarii]MXO88779.1 MBL fold metallo-hydrolase [Alteraurantiacibacter aestuarii]
MIRKLLALIALTLATSLATPLAAQDEPPLRVEVLRTSAGSLHVNSALIMGAHDAVLVDPPFTLADAHRVAAMVLDSGKTLTHIFVTHDHPDHFFAMEVLEQAFPDAEIVAHPTVVADIWRSLPFKVIRWSPGLAENGPSYPSAPHALTSDVIMLEGHELRVLGPMQGDHVHSTALWVPEIRALLPGDLVFNEVHLWLGEHDPAAVAEWGASVDRLIALDPAIVVAGHARPGLPDDASGLAFTARYLDQWPQLVARAADAADLQQLVRAEFPTTIDVLDNFILVNSTQVAMGEQPIWTE